MNIERLPEHGHGHPGPVELDDFLELTSVKGRSATPDLLALEVLEHGVPMDLEPGSQVIYGDSLFIGVYQLLDPFGRQGTCSTIRD